MSPNSRHLSDRSALRQPRRIDAEWVGERKQVQDAERFWVDGVEGWMSGGRIDPSTPQRHPSAANVVYPLMGRRL